MKPIKKNQNATMIFSINTPNNFLDANYIVLIQKNKLIKFNKNFQKILIMYLKNDNCEYKEDAK